MLRRDFTKTCITALGTLYVPFTVVAGAFGFSFKSKGEYPVLDEIIDDVAEFIEKKDITKLTYDIKKYGHDSYKIKFSYEGRLFYSTHTPAHYFQKKEIEYLERYMNTSTFISSDGFDVAWYNNEGFFASPPYVMCTPIKNYIAVRLYEQHNKMGA